MVRDPVGEGEPSAPLQDAEGFAESPPAVGNMKQCLLAHDDINALRIKRHRHHVTFNDANRFLKAHDCGQFLGARNSSGRELDSSDMRTVSMGEVACRASKP